MLTPTTLQTIGAALFGVAVLHTFSVKYFERLAHTHPRHAGFWHLLGEVEVVFGFWAAVLMLFMFGVAGRHESVAWLESRNFTEPMFVFAIMVVAGSRPILDFAHLLVRTGARLLPLPRTMALCFVVLSLVPLLGAFITEPAAMTLAALLLRDSVFACNAGASDRGTRLKYAILGVLFVNVSIGGTLTPFAAPPVLMVASTWGWDLGFMLQTFGWKSALAVVTNTILLLVVFRRTFLALGDAADTAADPVPLPVIAMHLLFLVLIVVFAHHPQVFMGIFLFFLGFTTAYQRYQDNLILREALLVAFFLAGLVVLGGLQAWWLAPLLTSMSADAVFFGTTALTAITDNAALTYLGAQVPGLSLAYKTALVGGAVAGGGLTLIANAPNPAGAAILKDSFPDRAISPIGLLAAATPPTLIAVAALHFL
ncbi:Putative Na+/H+ antiporter [Massilia sp. PDC64]|nr:putative Na+/H+ antiporter [Massilia sp. PDC64]SDD96119.1 Putative Na+/H+ antiporter [Massilia sp. PDC64]